MTKQIQEGTYIRMSKNNMEMAINIVYIENGIAYGSAEQENWKLGRMTTRRASWKVSTLNKWLNNGKITKENGGL